jgi:cobalt-zinc-cadmium efflux system outer membrane protein
MPSLCSAVLLFASVAVPPTAAVVDEASFVAPVLEGSSAQRLISEPLRRAEAALARAGAAENPRVEALREAPDEASTQTTVALAWLPPLDGRRGLAIAAAREGVEAARARSALVRAALALELRQTFADWALSMARRDALAGQVDAVATLAAQVGSRARAGEESGLAARRLALAEAEVRAGLAEAEAVAARARAVARAWRPDLDPTSRPTPPPLAPRGEGDASAPLVLEALRRETEQARLEERLSRRFWTFPEFQVGWQRLAIPGGTATGLVLGAGLVVPLLDRNRAGRLEATARREAAEGRLSLQTARVEAQLAGAHQAHAGLAAAAAEAQRVAADAGRVVDAATAAFRAGEATVTDLIDTLRSAREAQTRAIDLHAAALAAQRQLEAARAGLPEGTLR